MKKDVNKPEFFPLFTELIGNPELQPLDAIVYGCIYWLTKLKNERCTASNSYLAALSGCTPHSIQNSLTRLEKYGAISRRYKDDEAKVRDEIIPLIVVKKVSLNEDRVSSDEDTRYPQVRTGVSSGEDQNKKSKKEEIRRVASAKPKRTELKFPNAWYQTVEVAYRVAKGQIILNNDGTFTEKTRPTSSEVAQLRQAAKSCFMAGYTVDQIKDFLLYLGDEPYWSEHAWTPALIPRRIVDFVEGRLEATDRKLNRIGRT